LWPRHTGFAPTLPNATQRRTGASERWALDYRAERRMRSVITVTQTPLSKHSCHHVRNHSLSERGLVAAIVGHFAAAGLVCTRDATLHPRYCYRCRFDSPRRSSSPMPSGLCHRSLTYPNPSCPTPLPARMHPVRLQSPQYIHINVYLVCHSLFLRISLWSPLRPSPTAENETAWFLVEGRPVFTPPPHFSQSL
jgi:hypothetical protein